MQLVEQHVISKSDPRFQSIDEMAFASKTSGTWPITMCANLSSSSRRISITLSSITWSSPLMPIKLCLAKSVIKC